MLVVQIIVPFRLDRHLVTLDRLAVCQCRAVFPWAVDALELEVTELNTCLTGQVQDLVIRLATVDMSPRKHQPIGLSKSFVGVEA